MNNGNNDTLLRDKLSSLDTLSGGIVYGKEDAWDKLQRRMERKPAKIMVFKYAVAAAVLLVISLTSLFIYFSHNTQTEQNTIAKTSAPIPTPTAQPAHQQPVAKPETAQLYSSANTNKKLKQKANIEHAVSLALPMPDSSVMPAPENTVENKMAIQPTSVPPVHKPMRVVHLNELNREPEQTDNSIVYGPSIDVSTLPKVHINDMIHEENEIQKILQENRLGTGHQFFLWHNRYDPQENSGNDNTTEYPSYNKRGFRIN